MTNNITGVISFLIFIIISMGLSRLLGKLVEENILPLPISLIILLGYAFVVVFAFYKFS